MEVGGSFSITVSTLELLGPRTDVVGVVEVVVETDVVEMIGVVDVLVDVDVLVVVDDGAGVTAKYTPTPAIIIRTTTMTTIAARLIARLSRLTFILTTRMDSKCLLTILEGHR